MPPEETFNKDPSLVLKTLKENLRAIPMHKLITEVYGDIRRPLNSSRSTNSPYYKEKFAIELRDAVCEPMLDEQSRGIFQDKMLRYEAHPEYTHQTLYIKVQQSRKYLLDFLDTEDRKYVKFFDSIIVDTVSVGFLIQGLPKQFFRYSL